jgi:hypothetical protein
LQDNAAGSDAYAGKPAFSCFIENADSGIFPELSKTADRALFYRHFRVLQDNAAGAVFGRHSASFATVAVHFSTLVFRSPVIT